MSPLELREAIADRLAGLDLDPIDGWQIEPYLLSQPTPPCIQVFPGPVDYDVAMGRGADQWTLTVQALVGYTDDVAAQMLLDELLAAAGPRSIKAAIEQAPFDGVDEITVTTATGATLYIVEGRGPALGSSWTLEAIAGGAA